MEHKKKTTLNGGFKVVFVRNVDRNMIEKKVPFIKLHQSSFTTIFILLRKNLLNRRLSLIQP
jgi:hypothetical protein